MKYVVALAQPQQQGPDQRTAPEVEGPTFLLGTLRRARSSLLPLGIFRRSMTGIATVSSGTMTCRGWPFWLGNIVRKTSCRFTTAWRLCLSAATSSGPVMRKK